MKMDKIANSGNDEFYTPRYAVEPIIKYLKKGSIVWCPFDTEESLFVKILKENGFEVIYSHINSDEHVTNGDFFEMIEDLSFYPDYIISNPPYSKKTEVLEALFKSKYKFGMLLGVVGIFESQKRFDLFKNNQFEIMYLNRRVDYFKSFDEIKPSKNPPFSSVYITRDILPNQICFEEIDKKNIK